MDSEKILFEKGCFLPSWAEDVKEEQPSISQAYSYRRKDMETLISELNEIKTHLQDVQERQWQLAKQMHFFNNNFARE